MQIHRAVQIRFNNQNLFVDFEFYPATPSSLYHPGDSDEINILKIVDDAGKEQPIPELEDNGGNTDAEKIHSLLFDIMNREIQEAMQTIAIEPWD